MPQSTVLANMAFGVPGEAYLEGATDAAPWTLESSGVPNVIGSTAYTETAEGTAAAGGSGPFVGILANPKVYANYGTTGNALAPTMTLPDGAEGELVTFHPGLVVKLSGAGVIGGAVGYLTATGALQPAAIGATTLTNGFIIPGAKIVRFVVDSGGLAVISLSHG
jgi:hypothetical protein